MAMVGLVELWLPILLAGVLVFLVSSVIHVVLPVHRGDYTRLPAEDAVLQALRAASVGRGAYCFPHPGSMKDMSSPEMVEKYRQGPVGTMVVQPSGPPAMGKALAAWFGYCLVVGLLTAYGAGIVLPHGTSFLTVFRLTGTLALLGYAFTSVCDSIWKGVPWSVTFKFVGDGIVYSLATAGIFGWLWPD